MMLGVLTALEMTRDHNTTDHNSLDCCTRRLITRLGDGRRYWGWAAVLGMGGGTGDGDGLGNESVGARGLV